MSARAWPVVLELLRVGGSLDVSESGRLSIRGLPTDAGDLLERLRALPRDEVAAWAPCGPPPPPAQSEPIALWRLAGSWCAARWLHESGRMAQLQLAPRRAT